VAISARGMCRHPSLGDARFSSEVHSFRRCPSKRCGLILELANTRSLKTAKLEAHPG
jgi:hypothetical protein